MPVSNLSRRRGSLEEILRNEKEKLRLSLQSELTEKLGAEHSTQFENALDSGDLSFVDLLETIGMKLIDIRQDQLAKITTAEKKLKEGTYGVCEICGEEISPQRLTALPFAVHCIECAERIEGAEVQGKGPTL